ncbi:transglutaminase-like cysteine peptidase [Emcibacter sp. SYSU 3D8]|uniref:transglutaminase-like cysteine peptidase n=1 Tax=Emcibacter sp. SYSU 3D8 TaxID=3133969 RepID=UPI0031FF08E5
MERYQVLKGQNFDGFPLYAIESWQYAITQGENMKSVSQLVSLNASINQVPYRSRSNRIDDLQWPTPLEFITSGGECIGYAIAKFLALRESGWLRSTTLIVVGRLLDDTPHAVVVVRSLQDSEWFQLDNRTDAIVPTRHVNNFIPFFALSDTFIWIYKHDESKSPAPSLDRGGGHE